MTEPVETLPVESRRKVTIPTVFELCGCCVEETMVCDAHAVDHWNPAIWH